MEKRLRDRAKELLASGEVGVVIGYGFNRDRTHTTPVFITRPEDVEKLVFNHLCVNNLSIYLTRKYPDVKALGRAAVVVKGCDVKSIAALTAEGQIERDAVHIIGMTCTGVVKSQGAAEEGNGLAPLTAETTSAKCMGCDVRNPHIADEVLGEKVSNTRSDDSGGRGISGEIKALDDETPDRRWDFWNAHFSRCIKCYACRQACPLCYCVRCITDKNAPQWIETSAHPSGNLSWNLIRAMHLVGRCTFCGECERACPVDIPLNLINQKMAEVVKEAFDYRSGYDPEAHPPLIVYSPDDTEDFIK